MTSPATGSSGTPKTVYLDHAATTPMLRDNRRDMISSRLTIEDWGLRSGLLEWSPRIESIDLARLIERKFPQLKNRLAGQLDITAQLSGSTPLSAPSPT